MAILSSRENGQQTALSSVHKHYRVYGERMCSNVALSQLQREPFETADIVFRYVADAEGFRVPAEEPRSTTRHSTNVGCDLVVSGFSDRYLMSFENVCDFMVGLDGRYIECHASGGVGVEWVRSILYGMVMAFSLHLRGKGNLHASSFVTSTGAVGLMAAPGTGKSTLAASFGARGFPLLTDDILAIDESDGRMIANPGFPFASLSETSIKGVFGKNGVVPNGHVNADKMRLAVDGTWASPAVGPVDLGHLVVLSRSDSESEVRFERISQSEAGQVVFENTLCLEFLPQAKLAGHLAFSSRIVKSIPVWRLSYPGSYDRIQEAQEAILSLVD